MPRELRFAALSGLPSTLPSGSAQYLGRSHNLWHRACLLLEQGALERVSKGGRGGPEEPGESLDCLAELYGQLREEDLWGGLWQRRARHPETALALALEQQGCFEQAQGALEAAMARARQDHATLPASPLLQSEFRLWEEHWLRWDTGDKGADAQTDAEKI